MKPKRRCSGCAKVHPRLATIENILHEMALVLHGQAELLSRMQMHYTMMTNAVNMVLAKVKGGNDDSGNQGV